MKKGIGPFALLLIGLFGTIIVSGVGFMAFYNRTNLSKRAMIEINVIDGINKLELTKIGLPQALKYSFYQSSYLVSSQGGYYDLGSVDSYNCIPYWRIYDDTELPDYKKNLEQSNLNIFNNYVTSLKDEAQIPTYNSISIEEISEGSKVKVASDGKLKIVREKLTITDNSQFTIESTSKVIRFFEIGKENFVDTDYIGNQIRTIPTYSEALARISSLETELNSNLVDYDEDNIRIKLIPSQNLGLDDSNYTIRILVKIIDTSDKYLIYDYSNKKTELENIELNFYVVAGNYIIDPEKNVCEVKETTKPIQSGFNLFWPTDYDCITDSYGWRIHPVKKINSFHNGIDIAAQEGTSIYSATDGEVIFADFLGEYGNSIKIRSELDGKTYTFMYSHLMNNGILKVIGAHVNKGEKIGLAGSTGKLSNGDSSVTGAHLHFEIRDSSGNSVDPCNYLASCDSCELVT